MGINDERVMRMTNYNTKGEVIRLIPKILI